jgi:DNA processing protein
MIINEITPNDAKWPKSLVLRTAKIEKLWYTGELNPAIFGKCVAVVGSRRMSRYGKQVISEIVPRLVLAGYTIVSGLMYGVDQEAHKVALASGGRCIGVLGWGIDYECEEGATKLGKQVVTSGGIVLSEYAPGTVSQRWMFPQRNRIVAALSSMVIIVEAAEKSGTMSTARWAKKMGKKIFAVPGSMFSDTSGGANRLIANSEATLLTMKEVLGWSNTGQAVATTSHTSSHSSAIMTLLKANGPMGVNELSRQTGVSVGEILSQLMQAELSGKVVEDRGVWKLV